MADLWDCKRKNSKTGGWFDVDPNKERQIKENKQQADARNTDNHKLSSADIKLINDIWVNGDHHFISRNPSSDNAKKLESVLNKLPSHNGVIYRGSEDNPIRHRYTIGTDFSFNHIGAWSKNKAVAEMHASKHTSPVLYEVKNVVYGKDISSFVNSEKKLESEVLTPHNALYTIIGKSKKKIPNLEGDGFVVATIIKLKEK